ncbi:MAG: ABC transporter substrate-binding protein [Myxococcales bacterium]|jgi:phospholipid transport system substrate-binding protein
MSSQSNQPSNQRRRPSRFPRTLCAALALLLAVPLLSSTAAAQAKASAEKGATNEAGTTPKQIVERTVDKALAVLRDPNYSGADKRQARFEKVRDIVSEVFNWEDMAQRSLGVHWRSIDDAQRKRYVDLFKELLADRYMEDINRFRGHEKVIVHDMHKEGDSFRVDTTVITTSREEVPISYFLHAEGDTYKIHDFAVEGVSLVNHYRKSFSRFLVNRDFSELIKKLESKASRSR